MEAGIELANSRRICRVCLEENVELFSIFQNTHDASGVTIAHILTECTRYPVLTGDCQLPQHICTCCIGNARTAFDFKNQVEQSYCKLLGWTVGKLHSDTTTTVSDQTHSGREYGTQTDKVSLHPCEMCEMKFFDLLELRQHRRQIHDNSNLQCRICGMRFQRIRQLRSHLVHKHPSVGIALDTQCNICRRRFSRREHLNRHLRNIHHQPEAASTKVSLKEPIIDLANHQNKNSQKQEDNVANISANAPLEMDFKPEVPNQKSDDTVVKDSFLVPSHFLECDQEVSEDIDSDTNMDTNPISSDDDAYNGIELPDDILPQLKFEHETNIKTECELNDSVDGFDVNSMSPNWEHNTSRQLKKDIKEEFESVKMSSPQRLSGEKQITHLHEEEGDYTERRRITVVVDEFLAQNSAADKTADSENRCAKCQRTFSRHCHLRRHMLTHVEEKAHACHFCPKRFARSDHLKKHIMNLHQKKEFKCDQCNSAFARSVDLTKHQETRHGNDPQAHKVHNCEYCGKKFTSRTYLRKHVLIHTDRIFACKYCEETFKERKAFREHEKGHHSERRNFLCSVCGESFVRNDYLRVHMRRHNGEKPYKCQYCDKGFPRATDVKIHERYHTGTKPNLCNLCGKGFHRAYNLTIHMRTHTGERPYKCDECGRGFAQSNDLKAHIRRHTGERFKCNVCDAGFLQMYALRQHSQTIHGIHMEPATGRLQRFTLPESTVSTIAGDLPLTANDVLPAIDEQLQIIQQQQSIEEQITSGPLMPSAPS